MGIGNRRMIGRNLYLGGLFIHIDGNVIVRKLRLNMEMAKQLDWKNPCFKTAVLLSDKCAAFSCDGKWLQQFGVLPDRKIARSERKLRNRLEQLLRRCGQYCDSNQKQHCHQSKPIP